MIDTTACTSSRIFFSFWYSFDYSPPLVSNRLRKGFGADSSDGKNIANMCRVDCFIKFEKYYFIICRIDKQTDIWANRRTDEQTVRQTEKQTGSQTFWETDRKTKYAYVLRSYTHEKVNKSELNKKLWCLIHWQSWFRMCIFRGFLDIFLFFYFVRITDVSYTGSPYNGQHLSKL